MRECIPSGTGQRVVGIRGAGGPMRSVAIELGDGLTALYGLNGAGKTSTVDVARRAASGLAAAEHSWDQFVVATGPGSRLHRRITKAIVRRLSTNPNLASSLPLHAASWADFAHTDDLRQVHLHAVDDWLGRIGDVGATFESTMGERPAAIGQRDLLARELSGTTTYSVVARGVREPAWDIWIAIDPDGAPLPLREAVDAARSKVEAARASSDPIELDALGWHAIGSPAWGWTWRSNVPERAIDRAAHSELWGFIDDGLPVPFVYLCTLTGSPPVQVVDESTCGTDVSDATRQAVLRSVSAFRELERLLVEAADCEPDVALQRNLADWAMVGSLHRDSFDPAAWLTNLTDEWVASANFLLSTFLVDAPLLELRANDLSGWLDGTGLQWRADGMSMSTLSRAERRWAAFAIVCAVWESADLVIIDEPEASLHRAAEEQLAVGLSRPELTEQPWMVATHSPMVVDDARACYEVYRIGHRAPGDRGRGPSAVRPLRDRDRESLSRLGMNPSDLLHRHRVFVLVEGVHDEIVIETLLRDVLVKSRARVFPLHGGSKLAASLDAEFLLDYTGATILAVLDNLNVARVDGAWSAAQQIAWNDVDAAVDELFVQLPRRESSEHVYITDWLAAALRSGRSSRIAPFGLAAGDMIEYLPVDQLVPRARMSWQSLRLQHDDEQEASPKKKAFKLWLTERYGASFTPSAIREAVDQVTELPDDLRALSLKIEELGARPITYRSAT